MRRRAPPSMSSSSVGGSAASGRTHLDIPRTTSSIIAPRSGNNPLNEVGGEEHDDRLNYALLMALYTLQGIPMVSCRKIA
jgi:hypothetical protein